MDWFGFSLLSIFALASAELIQQHLLNLKNSFDGRTSGVLVTLIQSIIAITLLFIFGIPNQFSLIFNLKIFPQFLAVSLLGAIATILYFNSFRVKNISFSLIFVSFSAIVSTILGIIFFTEVASLIKFIGIILILTAIIIVNYKNSHLEKSHWYGLAAGFLFGICYTIDKNIILENIHPLTYISVSFFMVSLWGFILSPKKVIKIIKTQNINSYKPILLSALGYFLYNFFTFTAYTHGGDVGKIDAINNSEIFLIIIFEFFILENKKGISRKILSTSLAICGVLILGII